MLGPRPVGAIEEIAEPVARAVEVALRRQEREQQLEGRLQAIEAVLARLSKLGPSGRVARV